MGVGEAEGTDVKNTFNIIAETLIHIYFIKEKMEMELCNKGIDNLTVAIVKQAADDYLDNKKKWFVADKIAAKPMKLRLKLAKEFVELTKFFADKWYEELCTLDPSELISKLDTKFEEWKSNESEVNEFIRTHREKGMVQA